MSAFFYDLVPHYGALVVFAATFLSCLALPAPSSLVMLAGGALVASGDLEAPQVVFAALAGALLGDNLGLLLGRWGGTAMLRRLSRQPRRARLIARATRQLDAHAWTTVFLSRWLFSPLGPYVNFTYGAARLAWPRFAVAGAAGETVWVTLYTGLGWAFAAHLEELADTLGNLVAAMAAGAVAVWLGWGLRHQRRG